MLYQEQVMSIIVVTPDTSTADLWLPDLHSTAVNCPLTQLQEQLDQHAPDVIVATGCDQTHIDLFASLHNRFSIEERPAIVLFSDDIPNEYCLALVDAVLPRTNHPMVPYQIQQAVERKSQMAVMQMRIAALEEANRELQRKQTARQRTADEIETLKYSIVRNVTHELNTPLLQVKSAVALIAEEIDHNSLVEYALRATTRLEAVVKNITQLAASLNDMSNSPLIVRECIDSALRDLRRTWEYKDHIARIQVDIEPNLPLAHGDRQGISAVIQQLIDNALKFSKKDVHVRAQRQDDHIKISVQDYGIGIPKDQIEHIFESFYQVDSSSRRRYSGTGVGLANVRLILDRHGIDIVVESEQGKGSIFYFLLPTVNSTRVSI